MKTIPVLYENDEIIIVNKESGLPVQGGAKIMNSLDSLLPLQIGKKIFLVHRLDKDTAGILVVAKTPQAAAKWTKIISSKQVKKEYRAVCIGSPLNGKKEGKITENIEQHGKIKSAVTYYKIISENDIVLDNGDSVHLSYLSLILDTGRMHQIRIHLSKIGCPIAGDDKHGNFKLNKFLKKELHIKRLLLASVNVTIPVEGKPELFTIQIPSYMKDVVDMLSSI